RRDRQRRRPLARAVHAQRSQDHAGLHPQRRTADRAGVSRPGGEGRVARLCADLQGSGMMDATLEKKKPVTFNRWLPYWAVLQADVHQTLRSWVYRVWVLVSLLAAVGYLLYRFGLSYEAGIVQPASNLVADLLRWTLLGSVTLIVVLTAGSISS